MEKYWSVAAVWRRMNVFLHHMGWHYGTVKPVRNWQVVKNKGAD
jgi:hypothetical protein